MTNRHTTDDTKQGQPYREAGDEDARKFNGGGGGELKDVRFMPVAIDDIVLGDGPSYLVEDLIPAGPSLTIVVGRDKSGKSFVMTDALFQVAMGRPYYERAVEQGTVVYITSEGMPGVERRLVALRRHYGVEGKRASFYLVRQMVDLGNRADVELLIMRLRDEIPGPITAIALDPLMRAMPGKTDNDAKDMNVVADNAEHLAHAFTAAVVIGHHTPRGDDTRSRGSNVLDGGADAMWSVVKANGISTVTIIRMKDGPDNISWQFRLEPFDLGHDRKGKPISTCVCVGVSLPAFLVDSAGSAGTAQALRLQPLQKHFLDILTNAVIEAGATIKGTSSVPLGARAVSRDMLKRYCVSGGWLDEGETKDERAKARAKFSGMLSTLAGKHIIGVTSELVWLVSAGTAQAAQASDLE